MDLNPIRDETVVAYVVGKEILPETSTLTKSFFMVIQSKPHSLVLC